MAARLGKGARRWYVAGAAAVALGSLGAAPAMAGIAHGAQSSAAPDYVHACPPAPSGEMTCMVLRRTNIHAARVALADPAPAGLNPADLAAAYHLDTSGGAGQTVAIVDAYDDPNAESDLATYRAQFGLPACTTADGCFHKVNQSGADSPLPGLPPAGLESWGGETSLDLDMVSAVCPNCHILLVETNSQDNADLYAGVDAAAASSASFVSDSWGSAEYQGETNDDVHFNHPGKVIAFASGDDGHDGGVLYPAASQYVVAVGGTSLTRGTSGQFTESAWNLAGSGCSAYEPQLGWQIGPPDTQCANRAVADVSAVADPNTGVSVYDTIDDTGWDVFGGTSAATPIITAAWALAGPPPAADPASFILYEHFITRGPSVVPPEHVLTDITTGSNGDCGAPTCDARVGWDGPTGVGTLVGTGALTWPYAFGAIVTGDQATLAGTSVSLTVKGRDGTPPYTWSASGLPPGLSINSSTGVISGTPGTVGTYTVTITGHDATASPPGSYSFHWVINPPSMATVPDLTDDGRSQVAADLSAAGLVVGGQGTTVDCNHLGTVVSQNPRPGTQVARGSAVSVVFGTPPKPPRECP